MLSLSPSLPVSLMGRFKLLDYQVSSPSTIRDNKFAVTSSGETLPPVRFVTRRHEGRL
jgi:hypothetical protein